MKRAFHFSIILLSFLISFSAAAQLTFPPDGGNKKASVSERIGITDVDIRYDRPAVKGRDGKIWGDLVPYGFTDQGFGTSKSAPWRAGANENTTISFSTDVMIEGKSLPAGIYAFFIALDQNEATLIFSKNSTSWGSFFYNEKEDALRVNVAPVKSETNTERLKYEFSDQKDSSAVVSLLWENLRIPFTVSVNYVQTQLNSIRAELRSEKGFAWQAWVEAINFCLAKNINLEEALQWSDYAINAPFTGEKNFRTLSAKAGVLRKLNRAPEADVLMKQALPLASMTELHNYAKQLIRSKEPVLALEAFKLNAKQHPNEFTTNMGLARGYSANGDFKNAMKYLKLAQAQAPDKQNQDAIGGYLKMLGEGKDFN